MDLEARMEQVEVDLIHAAEAVREAAKHSQSAQQQQRAAIHAARDAGMTQAAIAQATGLTQGRIAQILKA